MDIPGQDISAASIATALIVGALGYLGTSAIGWLADVDDSMHLVRAHDAQISDVSENVKVIREVVEGNARKIEGIEARAEVIEKVTLQNQELGNQYRRSLEED